MRRSFIKWGACCRAILSYPAVATETAAPAGLGADPSVGGDPWGPLDDMVGKRFKSELVDLGMAVELEYSWEVPDKIIREQTVGGAR